MADADDGPGYEGEPDPGPSGLFLLAGDGPQDPQAIAQRLIQDEPAFTHLRAGEAVILFLMRAQTKAKGGKNILGEMVLPKFQGSLGSVGTWLLATVCGGLPDYIMLLDNDWWMQAPPERREALVYHEMCHAEHAVDKHGELRFTEDGDVIWGIKAHDLEEFDAVVRRYGAWLPDVTSFVGALRDGGVI